ncbi:MAG TPA: hypothetical protein PKD12_02790 [Nitrospira sp.]|nr:hypothetical protein [Nitrospira sp.]
MSLSRLMVVLCIGCGIAFAASFVEAGPARRGLPERGGELTKTFNEKAKERYPSTPTKPPETPIAGRQGGPTPPGGFRNPGF